MITARIKQFIDSKGISIAAFEKSIGMSNASFSKLLKTNGTIGANRLEDILTIYTDLNPLWLVTGEGEMTKETKPELIAENIPQLSNVEILLRDMLAEKEAKIDALQERINDLIEENARLRTLMEHKGGVAPAAEGSSAVGA